MGQSSVSLLPNVSASRSKTLAMANYVPTLQDHLPAYVQNIRRSRLLMGQQVRHGRQDAPNGGVRKNCTHQAALACSGGIAPLGVSCGGAEIVGVHCLEASMYEEIIPMIPIYQSSIFFTCDT
mmetsp:Transcript_59013/g.116889  ORF Transcript_59013/g.116889 Transcript_59013/m.116889 type:complete len:123 (+) Transcript_59013:53-421(+)